MKLRVMLVVAFIASGVNAQDATKQPTLSRQDATVKNVAIVRDAAIEAESYRDLKAAQFYFKERKAYVASLDRAEVVIAGNPNFARIDEVLYIAGTSSLRLARNEGKQTSKLPADKLREQGQAYLTQLVKDYPQSDFRKRAEAELKTLASND